MTVHTSARLQALKAAAKTKKELGERGKGAEDEVQKYLNSLNSKYANFEFERIYDARSAGGKFPARPGDFAFCRRHSTQLPNPVVNTWHGLIEVKELKHDYRLPKGRLDSLPKLVKREMAGGVIVVLIKHTEQGVWRCPPFEFFRDNQGVASWDLRGLRVYDSLEEALCTSHRALR